MVEKLFSLGARLNTCAEFVRTGKVVADIGTDHAYLPIWLIATGKNPFAYASDINEEPIRLARSNVDRYRLTDKVITFTGDGLENIDQNAVDDIVIAGMGGDSIIGILKEAPWLKNYKYRLILQPMSKVEKLREYLFRNNFNIIKEKAICESNKLYTVICAEYSLQSVKFEEHDFYIGRLSNLDPCSVKLLKRQVSVLTSEINGAAKSGDIENEKRLRKLVNNILNYINKED